MKQSVKIPSKNNLGLTLVEVMVLGTILACLAAAGAALLHSREKEMVAAQSIVKNEQFQEAIANIAGQTAVVDASESLEFEHETTDPTPQPTATSPASQ